MPRDQVFLWLRVRTPRSTLEERKTQFRDIHPLLADLLDHPCPTRSQVGASTRSGTGLSVQ